jgi:hypothetical protein
VANTELAALIMTRAEMTTVGLIIRFIPRAIVLVILFDHIRSAKAAAPCGLTSRNLYLMAFRLDRQFMNFSKNRPEAIIRSHQKAKRRDRMRISPIKYSFQSG